MPLYEKSYQAAHRYSSNARHAVGLHTSEIVIYGFPNIQHLYSV